MEPTCERVVERLYGSDHRYSMPSGNSRSASARTPIHASIVWRAIMALGGLVGLVGQKP